MFSPSVPKFQGSQTPIVVVGMYRSGTSMVARCLTELGAYFGDKEGHFPTDRYNPGGYFEIVEMMELNRKVLGFFGMQHLRIEDIPAHWLSLPEADLLTEDLGVMVKKHFQGQSRWGFKEPQVTPLLPVYEQVFKNLDLSPTFVICVRNPLDVMGTNMLPRIGAGLVGLWLHWTLSALKFSRGFPRMVVPYEVFLETPKPFLETAASLQTDWKPSEEQFLTSVSTVKPEWRTNRNDESLLENWPPLVKTVLKVARICAANPDEFIDGNYDPQIDRLWEEWQITRDMAKTRSIPHGKLTLMEQGEDPKREEVWVIPTDGWQTVSIKVPATRESGLLMEIYQNPAVIWIRNAYVKGNNGLVQANLSTTVHGSMSHHGTISKLVQWGWFPLFLHLPQDFVAKELEMDIYIQWNVYSVEDATHGLRNSVSRFWEDA